MEEEEGGGQSRSVTRKFEKWILVGRLSLFGPATSCPERPIYHRFSFPARVDMRGTSVSSETVQHYHEKIWHFCIAYTLTPTRYLTRYVDTRQILGNRAQLNMHTRNERGFISLRVSAYCGQTLRCRLDCFLVSLSYISYWLCSRIEFHFDSKNNVE